MRPPTFVLTLACRMPVLLLALWFAGPAASAAEVLRLIVAWPAGGPVDLVARQLEPLLQRSLGRPLVIENLPGAGGAIGVGKLLAATDDAPAWLVGTPSETIVAPLLNPALAYRPAQLRLLGVASTLPVALVGRMDGPRALAALLAERRAGAQPVVCGNYGIGSHAHLAGQEFAARTGVPLLHVPHAGAAPLLRELVAGRVDLAFLPLNRGVLDLISQDRLRLLALAGERRDERFPAVPTVDEATGLAGFRHTLWVGVFLAATASDAAVRRARSALHDALRDPGYRAQKLVEGVLPGEPLSEAELRRLHAEQIAHYTRQIEALPR